MLHCGAMAGEKFGERPGGRKGDDMNREQIVRRYRNHALQGDQAQRSDELHSIALGMAMLIQQITPPCPEQGRAFEALDAVVQHAVNAMVWHERWDNAPHLGVDHAENRLTAMVEEKPRFDREARAREAEGRSSKRDPAMTDRPQADRAEDGPRVTGTNAMGMAGRMALGSAPTPMMAPRPTRYPFVSEEHQNLYSQLEAVAGAVGGGRAADDGAGGGGGGRVSDGAYSDDRHAHVGAPRLPALWNGRDAGHGAGRSAALL